MGELPLRSGNTTYYHIFEGGMCKTVKPGTEGAKQRTNKNGEEVFEVFVGGLEGMLTGIEQRSFEVAGTTEYSWDFTIEADGVRMVLGLPVNSRIASQFLSRLPLVDFNKPIAITTGKGFDKEKGKDFTWCNVYQGKDKIPSNFTKDNPNGMPPLEVVTFKGKEQYDNTAQLAFFDKLVEEVILPKIKASVSAETFAENPGDISDPKNAYPSTKTKDIQTEWNQTCGTSASTPPVNDASPPSDLPFD